MSDVDLTLTGLADEEVEAVLGGVSTFQMQAFAAGNVPKVAAAGNALLTLAEENPEAVREAFLRNQEAFRVANMPEEVLDHLDLEVQDGTLYQATDDGDWTEVDIE